MTNQDIINKLVLDRENTLSVKRIQVNLINGSMGNPCISVGTLPFYDWDKSKEMQYVLCYGRFLNCEMMVYDKQIKKDDSYIIVKGKDNAVNELTKILTKISSQ